MPAENNQQIFKKWVPTWLIYVSLFVFLIPVAIVLGIYMSSIGITAATTYYGVDAIDIRYSIVIYYLAIATFFPLEARFFNFFSSKPYLTLCITLYMLINLLLYNTHSYAVLVTFRFIGGAVSHGIIGIMFTLVFKQFHEQRSRVLGYATLYSVLFGTAPLANLINAYLFQHFSFNSIFLFKMFSVVPGTILMLIIIRNNTDLRRQGKIPLKSADWPSFVLYATSFLLLGYIYLYGQYYHWFNSVRITCCALAFLLIFSTFVLRQLKLPTPYINLRIFKTRNFRIGMLLLILFYFSKGDMGLLNGFIAHSVNLDSYHYGYLMLINGFGVMFGCLITARFILANRRIRLIWMTGFGALWIFHFYSFLIINHQAEASDLLIPLFFQGFGNGILILSIVIFYATSVPAELGPSASVTGVAFRSTTFTFTMGFTGVAAYYLQKIHHSSMTKELTSANPDLTHRIGAYAQNLMQKGLTPEQSHAGALKLFGQSVAAQNNLLFVRDYYLYVSIFIALVIMGIALIPHFSYHIKKIGNKLIPI
nr:MFS transporter [uncultured Carboxylicivirga sp.]